MRLLLLAENDAVLVDGDVMCMDNDDYPGTVLPGQEWWVRGNLPVLRSGLVAKVLVGVYSATFAQLQEIGIRGDAVLQQGKPFNLIALPLLAQWRVTTGVGCGHCGLKDGQHECYCVNWVAYENRAERS